ncbi:MAG: hypothetical protein ABI444_12300 [Candidatus Kapaibacterium sp.]|jgi:hypothetical protein
MKFIIGFSILTAVAYFIWWGYKNLVGQETKPESKVIDGALCHLCRKPYPYSELVVREKMAGFENYFCGSCINDLVRDYNHKLDEASVSSQSETKILPTPESSTADRAKNIQY